ncbi:MAG: hypothetical protein ACFFCW_24485 [Candidatus Hodarchaeota archaeon]
MEKLPKKFQYTSSINIGEIYYGANRSGRRDQIIKAFAERVFPQINILGFDETSGKLFGELKASLESQGIVYSEPDLRIASITIQHNYILVKGVVLRRWFCGSRISHVAEYRHGPGRQKPLHGRLPGFP